MVNRLLQESICVMFVGMDHVGVAVKNLDEAVKVYRDVLGFELRGVHVLEERKVKVAFFSMGGEAQVELLGPWKRQSCGEVS